jgi:hypothetical protein
MKSEQSLAKVAFKVSTILSTTFLAKCSTSTPARWRCGSPNVSTSATRRAPGSWMQVTRDTQPVSLTNKHPWSGIQKRL